MHVLTVGYLFGGGLIGEAVPVHDGHVAESAGERASGTKPRNPGTDDDRVRWFGHAPLLLCRQPVTVIHY